MVTLYSAEIEDIAVPVKKEKKIKATKTDPVQELTAPSTPTQENVSVSPRKKELSEKQREAIKKAQETRKRKREEKLELEAQAKEAAQEKERIAMEKEKEKLAKKEEVKKKRRLARLAKKNGQETETLEEPAPKKVRTRKQKTDSLDDAIDKAINDEEKDSKPPAWFEKYVKSVKSEESKLSNDKKPKTVINQEAATQARTQWSDGLVRDRVQNEVDGHMSRMYSMIFGARKL